MNERLNRAANLFLLLLGSECLLKLIQDSFHLTAGPKTYGWLALLCILLWAAAFFRRCFFPGVFAAAGVLWCLIRYGGEELRPELLDVLRAVRSACSAGFWNKSSEAVFQASAETHALALLLILSFAAAYLAAVLSAESFRVSLGLLLTLPLAALCLAVNRNPPALPLLGMGLFWAGLLIGGDAYRPHDAAGQAVLLTLLPCLAVLGIALYFHNPSSYAAEDQALSLSQRFERLSSAVSSLLDSGQRIPQMMRGIGRQSDALSGWDQGQDGLDLTQPYDYSARRHEIFTLRSSFDGSLYLRGRSFGSYTGTGWSEAEEQAGSQVLNYTAYAVAAAGYTGTGIVKGYSFEIEADRAYDLLYLPYFTFSEANGDVSVPAGGKTAYAGQFLLLAGGGLGPLPDSLQREELQYRSFVRDYYTRLPESTRSALADAARINGLDAEDGDILTKVTEYVCRDSTYDLGVGAYPDSDYAVYFLLTARRGYCIHYATAACCVFRALGIPARLCEGFAATVHPGGETIVRAADAHVWVEVWLDGVGWVPVEATAGDSPKEGEADDSLARESEAFRTEDTADHNSLPENPEAGSAHQGTVIAPAPSEAPVEKGGDADNGAFSPENGGVKADGTGESPNGGEALTPTGDGEERDNAHTAPEEEKHPRAGRLRLAVLGVLAVVTLVVAGRYALTRRRLRRWLAEPDGRLRAICIYRQAQRVLQFGGEMPEAIQIPAEKASFSPHNISEDELRHSWEALNELTDQVQSSLRPLRRLLFRYHLGL